jgi:molybdate transport system substrate-binding protein
VLLRWVMLAFVASCSIAAAAEITVLSAGAIEPGLAPTAAAFERERGDPVKITYATAPTLRKRVGEGEVADVVIAPPAVLEDFEKAGKVRTGERVTIGRVGVGVAVRADAPRPDISSGEALRRSVLGAESLVFNQASTGLYFEGLLTQMGIATEVQAKTTRYPDGASVMEHLIRGKGREVGVGAITEILLYRDRGLQLVGPLPAEVQHYTTYAAVPMMTASNAAGARALVRFLASPAAKALFAAHGID